VDEIKHHPAFIYNEIALRLGSCAAGIAAAAVFVLYRGPQNWLVGTAVLLMALMLLAVHKFVLPRVRTLAQMDLIVASYLTPIFFVQTWAITFDPQNESSTGAACLIILSGLLFTSTAVSFITAVTSASLWLIVKREWSGHLAPNDVLQLLLMAPVSSLVARYSVARIVTILQESRRREQEKVVELSQALLQLQEETRLREDSEARLLQAEKRASLGVMAAGVAHDFNNTLRGITAFAELIVAKPDDPNTRDHGEQICRAVQHAAGICSQMLTYTGRSSAEKSAVDLSKLIHDSMPLLKASIVPQVQILVSVEQDETIIHGNATQLQQVLMNLVKNSADAIEASGTISIHLRYREVSSHDDPGDGLWINPPDARKYVEIGVTDSGCGMPSEMVTRIFDPYFSTKRTGHGLGLSSVHGIATSHNAALGVLSSLGAGTTVTMLFPRLSSNDVTMSLQNQKNRPALQINQSREILVVDDDELVRTPLVKMLQLLGWTVTEAASGEAAVAATREKCDYAAILVDYSMSGMNGRETVRAIRRNGCTCPAILCSGYISSEEDIAYEKDFDDFLQKPFRCQDLETLLKRLTGRQATDQ